ncbi:hypothetical protein Sru01_49570 [Sphaerisporangium rufum]|uniref:CopC domain-containing protein n=1 Tax=Sphaerisporangium rufum TaxID=1381558 RepID=A0A919R860_9ACTN|nr:copper resistance protein CopC [Sphaerisporangium rufum]GII79975.1 hypothetical protein Sru01_49570 [Sphaerisporangium rufum]
MRFESPAGAGRAAVRFLRRVLLPVVTGMLVIAGLAPAAEAHGQLALSMPAKDGRVTEPLAAVSLYFTERPISYAYFTVTAPNGDRVDRHWTHGAVKRLDEPVRELFLVNGVWEPKLYHEGFEARVPVAYWPAKGVYVASYWTAASDGDVVRGEVRFTYAGRTTKAPKGWQTPKDPPDPALLVASGQTPTDGPQAAVTASGAPSAACTPRTMPETGCDHGPEPAAGSTPAAAPAAPADSGGGLLVWLLPALLVIGAGVMIARAARPRAAGGRPAAGRSGRPGGSGKRPAARRPGKAPRAGRR